MHSSFSVLRNPYGTNFVAKFTGNIPITKAGRKDIERMLQLWNEARLATISRLKEIGEVDSGYLFGAFSIANAFSGLRCGYVPPMGYDINEY
jgi:hypothetical protein